MKNKSISLVVFLLVIMFSHTLLVSSISGAKDFQKTEDLNPVENTPDIDFYKTPAVVNDESRTKIVLFDSFQSRDELIDNYNAGEILYIFNLIPALTIIDSENDISAQRGVIQVVNDRQIVSPLSDKDIVSIGEGGGMTLKTSAIITGVDEIRSKYGLSGKGVKIAILDSGINPNLPAFADENGDSRVEVYNVTGIIKNSPPQLDEHGSHVAGIAASNGIFRINNKLEQTDSYGMAPSADILSIRVLDNTGSGDNSWILEGIDYALNRTDVDVISMSLSTNLFYGENDLHRLLLEQAPKLGKVVVGAAGNQGPMGSGLGIPGGLEAVIGVGAYEMSSGFAKLWRFSAIGPGYNDYAGPDLLAPGINVLSVNVTDNTVVSLSGTSMAAPHISGGVLLLLEAFPDANPYQIREALLASAIDIGRAVEGQGRGRVDFSTAYSNLADIMENGSIYVPTMPNKFYDGNYYFRNRIEGLKKSFPIYMVSHANTTITPNVDSRTSGVRFELPTAIDVKTGYNRFELNITVDSNNIRVNRGYIYFTDTSGDIIDSANITYFSETRYPQGTVLFDTAHDMDTPSGYFANHGPRGQFSRMARTLEEEGYAVLEHRDGSITPEILKNIDLLVIADPDINSSYSAAEITTIKNFVQVDGKSMLIMASGGFLTAEHLLYDEFNRNDINLLLAGTGLSVPSDDPIVACGYSGIGNRESLCPKNAYTISGQQVFDSVIFPSYGPSLKTDSSGDYQTSILAYQNFDNKDNPVIVGSELASNGRVLLFSSTIQFDNIGTTYDYVGGGNDVNNRQMARDAIKWLLSPRGFKIEYSIDSNKINDRAIVSLNEQFTLTASISYPNGTLIDLGDTTTILGSYDSLTGTEVSPFNLTLSRVSEGVYSIPVSFGSYGIYNLYLPVSRDNMVSTAGHLSLLAELYFMSQAENIQSVVQMVLILLLVSWIIWIRNEGGWQLKAKKEREKADE